MDHLPFSRNMGHAIVLYQLCVEVVVFLLVVGVASKLGKYVKVLCLSMCFEKIEDIVGTIAMCFDLSCRLQ